MTDCYRLVMAISLLLWVVCALVVSAVVSIGLYSAAAVALRWYAATRSMFASLASSGGARIVLLIAFYGLSSVGPSRILARIVLSSSCASMLLLILVLRATLRIGASWSCILVCIATGALLCRLMTVLAILIQTVVVLVTLILTWLLTVILSSRIVLRAPGIARGGWRIAFVLRVHLLRLECLFRGLSW